MSDTVHTIALGGLLHDIGKFMQRAEVEKEYPEIKDNYAEFCPTERSYLHAAHTAYFIQRFVPDGLFDKTELYQAAHHHVSGPGDLYREADCLSSGMERKHRDTSHIISSSSPLADHLSSEKDPDSVFSPTS